MVVSNKKRKPFSIPEQTVNFIGQELPTMEPMKGDYDEDIRVDEIAPSPHQTREISIDDPEIVDLSTNIEEYGLMHPIGVRPHPNQDSNFKWLLIYGERRITAYKRLGKEYIWAKIHVKDGDNEEKAWAKTVSENIHRSQLKLKESSAAIEQACSSFKMSHGQIAQRIGVSKARVTQLHGATKLPQDLIKELEVNKKLTKRHIDAFKILFKGTNLKNVNVENSDLLEIKKVKESAKQLLEYIIKQNLSGEDAVKYAQDLANPARIRSFLTSVNQKLPYLINRRPEKMSLEKRKIVIRQAQNMIALLSKLIEEEQNAINNHHNA